MQHNLTSLPREALPWTVVPGMAPPRLLGHTEHSHTKRSKSREPEEGENESPSLG